MRIMQVSLAAALGLGGVALLSTPAEAAAIPCRYGRWIMTSQKGVFTVKTPDGTTRKFVWSGAAGTKLTLSAAGAAFDFDKAKVENHTETSGSQVAKRHTTYRKTLKLRSTFKGSAKGTFNLREETAQGSATAQITYTEPEYMALEPFNFAEDLRMGAFRNPVVSGGSFACNKRQLVLTHKEKNRTRSMSHLAVYRRV